MDKSLNLTNDIKRIIGRYNMPKKYFIDIYDYIGIGKVFTTEIESWVCQICNYRIMYNEPYYYLGETKTPYSNISRKLYICVNCYKNAFKLYERTPNIIKNYYN